MGDGIANNDYVTTANISGVTALDIRNQNISNLTGIEDFSALQTINCDDNQLTNLDLSNNSLLSNLSCMNNQLTSLNLTGLTSLQALYCRNNFITSLNLSGFSLLNTLDFSLNWDGYNLINQMSRIIEIK